MTEALVGPLMTGAGSSGNFLVGMGNFVYQIAKDAGATMSFEQASAEGVSNADTAFEIDPASYRRYSLQGIWYTHTRAWSSTVHKLHSHTKTRNPKKLKSSYLCTVCPLEITYETARPNVAKFRADFADAQVAQAQRKIALHKEVLADLPDYTKPVTRPKRPARPKKPDEPGDGAHFQTVRAYERDLADYEKRQKEYDAKKERYDIELAGYKLEKSTREELKKLIEERKQAQLASIAAQQKVLDKRKVFLDALEKSGPSVTYMQNFTVRCTDNVGGRDRKSWQNVKVRARFEVKPIKDPTKPGMSVGMTWDENCIGYGNTWHGRIDVFPGEAEVSGDGGKFQQRFNQFARIQQLN